MKLPSSSSQKAPQQRPLWSVDPKFSLSSGRLDREFLTSTQHELDALLKRMRGRPNTYPLGLPRNVARRHNSSRAETQLVPIQLRQEEELRAFSGNESSRQPTKDHIASKTNRPEEASGRRAMAQVLAIGIGTAVVASLAFALHLAVIVRIGNVDNRVARLEETRKGFENVLAQRLAIQDRQVAELSRHMDEARFPSASFKNAQDLMDAGKYLEAEAIYGSLLVTRPTSSLSPIIAGNSAIANSVLGHCSMVAARLALLRTLRPQDELLSQATLLSAECARRRRSRIYEDSHRH